MESKVILITGGSTGIGLATAKLFLSHGYKVVVTSRTLESLERLNYEINDKSNFLTIQSDVSNWSNQKDLLTQIISKFNKIDIVYANAGFSKGSSFVGGEDTPEEWKEMILTNVYGAALTARVFLPELIKNKGHLLFTGSVVGRIAAPGRLYSSTKWAVTGMAESIRKEILNTGVRVTLIEPGVVDTPFWNDPKNDTLRNTPVNTLKDEDIANAVMYAVSQVSNIDVSEILIRPVGQQI